MNFSFELFLSLTFGIVNVGVTFNSIQNFNIDIAFFTALEPTQQQLRLKSTVFNINMMVFLLPQIG